MTDFLDRHGLSVDSRLARFVEEQALPGTGLDTDRFWADFAALPARFAPDNAALLARREELQANIDAWHHTRSSHPPHPQRYEEPHTGAHGKGGSRRVQSERQLTS